MDKNKKKLNGNKLYSASVRNLHACTYAEKQYFTVMSYRQTLQKKTQAAIVDLTKQLVTRDSRAARENTRVHVVFLYFTTTSTTSEIWKIRVF